MGTVTDLGRQVIGGGFHVEVEAQGQGLAQALGAVSGVRSVDTIEPDRRFRLLCERDVRPEAAAAVVGAGGRLFRLGVEEPSLEVIYTRYFEDQSQPGERHAA
jgi:ABC-2 type transport system ATP-binding protein